jgi:two-component system, OmpR family, response regulator ChvI
MWHHSNKGNKSIKFTDDSLKCCVCFIEFQSLINNSSLTYDSSHIRKYYSTVINSLAQIIKRNNGKIVKSLGDRLLCYFLNFSDINNEKAFEEVIQCGLEILEKRKVLNKELLKDDLPPVESYKICLDYGVVDLALAGDNYQIDIFGSTVNICSKINSSLSLSLPNEIIIGNNFYRILKSFSNIVTNYNFSNNGEFKVTENIGYLTYNLKRRDNILANDVTNYTHPIMEKQLNSSAKEDFIKSKNKKGGFFSHKNNNNKKIIIVDDNQEVLFTYRLFLEDYNYHITSFTDPFLALNYIKESTDFDNLLVILDIRMEHLNGFQLHQHIKSIDPTIKILFVTVLDILDELLTIIPGLTKEQIMRKPVDKKLFTNTVKNILN